MASETVERRSKKREGTTAVLSKSFTRIQICKSSLRMLEKAMRAVGAISFIRLGLGYVYRYLAQGSPAEDGVGSRGTTSLFGIQFIKGHTGKSPSDTHNPTNTRETLHGRLRGQTHKGQGRYGHHRPTETYALSLFEPLPQNEGSSRGWRMVEIPGS